MSTFDVRIDTYIDKSMDFAKPILSHLRDVVHETCLDVEETMKWSFPHFMYKGRILCSMASFKKHCSFGFWMASSLQDSHGLLHTSTGNTGMGDFGKLEKMEDLPSDKILSSYIRNAMSLNEMGIVTPKPPKKEEAPAKREVPDDMMKAITQNKKALTVFEAFSPSKKYEYIEWITEAKTEATRSKRMATMLEWLAEGKSRMWKYQK